jgi:hypothetical protein
MGQFIMKSHQVARGDVLTESGLTVAAPGARDTREVRVDKIERGELAYGRMIAEVHYITGTDLRNGQTVKWCKSPWHRWLVTRNQEAPVLVGV